MVDSQPVCLLSASAADVGQCDEALLSFIHHRSMQWGLARVQTIGPNF
jgi:hypothetical protein